VRLKQRFTQALAIWLKHRHEIDVSHAPPRWQRAYGSLRHLRREHGLIEKSIESEFEKIEPEDRS